MQQKLRVWWEKKFFRIAVYVGFGVVSFLFFLVMTFPDHRIAQIVGNEVEQQLGHQYEVDIENVGFWWLTGVSLHDIELSERRAAAPGDGEDGEPQDEAAIGGLSLHVDRIAGRFSPFRSLANRSPTGTFRIDTGGGRIHSTYYQQTGPGGNAFGNLEVSTSGLDLGEAPLLGVLAVAGSLQSDEPSPFLDSLADVRLLGSLDTDVQLSTNAATGGVSGEVDISGEQVTLGAAALQSDAIPLITELQLPMTNFGYLNLQLGFEETDTGYRVSFDRFDVCGGRDARFEVWGDIEVYADDRPSDVDVKKRIQFNREFLEEYDLNLSILDEGRYQIGGEPTYGVEFFRGDDGDVDFRGSMEVTQGPEDGEEQLCAWLE